MKPPDADPTRLDRRQLLYSVAGVIGGLSPDWTARSQSIATEPASQYLFAPGLIYLNTAALGPTTRSVLERTLQAWNELESNPVIMAYNNGAVHAATDTAREQLAGLLNCTADELLITRSATAAMNSLALGMNLLRGDRVLTTDVEHEGGTNGWFYLKRRAGVEVDLVTIGPTDHDVAGILERFERAMTGETRVVFVSHVVGATGLRLPVREISTLARRRGIVSIVDGAQAVGAIDVDVRAIGCDAYVGTGHKWIMGPKGTGFAYIKKDSATSIQPIEWEQGKRFVSGSTGIGSLPLVIGLGEAARAMKARDMRAVEQRTVGLRDRAYAGLAKIRQITLYSPPPGPLASSLVAFKLPDAVDSREFRDRLLSKYKIVVKIAEKRWFNGTRLSPHIFNTESEIDSAVDTIKRELA
jgi:selenocysteine lyase/cysteine desulfurase